MEITQADLRIGDFETVSICESFHNVKYEIEESESNETEDRYTLDINHGVSDDSSLQASNSSCISICPDTEPNLNSIQHLASDPSNVTQRPIYPASLNSESENDETNRCTNQAAEVLIKTEDNFEEYNISSVVIPSDILDELSLSIKKEKGFESSWATGSVFAEGTDRNLGNGSRVRRSENLTRLGTLLYGHRERLRKKAECMREKRKKFHEAESEEQRLERLAKEAECVREKRKKLYEEENEEQRLERLAKEAAKRRDMRRYYESPEQRRKRLDTEAARKREYRMFNETPDERRKRLDREAERRRVKRLTMYASETPDQKRERLNRESAKRREARVNQYAKETEDQRQERLRKDALRAREMRFTRSAIESEEERRQRLVKDALRKRELRMHGGTAGSHFTELQTVRNFEELNNVQMKDDPDNQLGGHYLSNWMMWFQNTITQPPISGDKSCENQQQTHV